jgi:transglutaminase-like putative cysteine protease
MDTAIVRRAAEEAIGTETNLLRKMYSIRNYVYDQLSYGIKPHIDTPDRVLERGVGSCGEYVGVLLALCRLNGIACRTVGRYKCPPYAEHQHVPLQPDYNHVWLEFYIPGFGWLPMESNPDDIGNYGPYPTRFFMGLCWYHIEIGKGIPFETLTSKGVRLTKEDISIGELAINHIRFTILGELPPF